MGFIPLLFSLYSTIIGWSVVATDGPAPRYINQLVDNGEGLLLYGGKNDQEAYNDLWIWKEGKWTEIGTSGVGRWDHSYAYLETTGQLVVFGGRAFQNVQGVEERVDLSDTRIFQDGHWEELEIDNPGPRSSHGMASQNGRVILYGGRNGSQLRADTWAFDGMWSRVDAGDTAGPGERYGHSMAYDPASRMIYLFGGFDGQNLLNDLWAFDGAHWTEIDTKTRPAARMAHSMQFNSQGVGVLFGGWDSSGKVSDECWIWNGNWKKFDSGDVPQGRLAGALGYDRAENHFILFGGSLEFGGKFLTETWKLSENPNH